MPSSPRRMAHGSTLYIIVCFLFLADMSQHQITNDVTARPPPPQKKKHKQKGTDCLTTPPTVTGNLAWAMQLYYQVYLYTLDTDVLKQMYPLLRRTVNFYIHYQTLNATDNKYHLPPTFSPEYAVAPDCNYDLALYRHALKALVSTIQVLGILDPRLPLYKTSLAQLRDPPSAPVGSQYPGYWIGEGVPLSSGHRHFSHLFMIFPLKQINFTDPHDKGTCVLLRKSS